MPALNEMGTWLAVGAADVSPYFALLTLVLVMAVLVSLVFVRFRQSLLVGYLACGVVIGNFGLMWATGIDPGAEVIANFAEIGVVLLMFTLGIEFSISELRHLWRVALLGGGLQVLLTGVASAGVAALCGFGISQCVLLGVAVALSSTAVAMKSFQDMGQTQNPGARASLGIALFQDILVIMVFLVIPVVYRSEGGEVGRQLGLAALKGVAFLICAGLLGRYGITPLLHAVAKTRSRELFTLTVIGLCVGIAYAGAAFQLSLALGAFAAGLVVSESIYSHRILSDILPFKDLFLAIFFISIGLLIDLSVVAEHWVMVLIGGAVVLGVKGLIAFGVLRVMKLPGKPAVLAAWSLASTGEFSLILLGEAGKYGALNAATEQILLVTTAVTMAFVPALMRMAGPLAVWLEEKGVLPRHQVTPEGASPKRAIKRIEDHAVICGYGPVGRSLNEALKRCGVETLVMELNVETVRELKEAGQPVLFADATHPEALDLAGVQRARLVAFTFPAVEMTAAAVPLVRERNPGIFIFGRAKFGAEANRLRALDVKVIHDERESAVAMVRAAVSSYDRPDVVPAEVVSEVMEG